MPNDSQNPPPVSQGIQPQQTPFSFTVGTAQDENGQTKAILRLDTVLGPIHFFMEPGMMKFIGQVLMQHGTQIEATHAGIVVPNEQAIQQINKPVKHPFKVVQ